jgi:hypothetical protein
MPERPPAPGSPRKRGCGCLVSLIVLLAIAGAIVAGLVPFISSGEVEVFVSDEQDASSIFIAEHPEWYVEVTDRPEDEPQVVRLVVWHERLGVGRIALMDPADGDGWTERPLFGLDRGRDPELEDALLEAFGRAWSDIRWSYLETAQPVDGAEPPEEWVVRYRLWEESTSEWTEVREARAFLGDGEWVVAGPTGEFPVPGSPDATGSP